MNGHAGSLDSPASDNAAAPPPMAPTATKAKSKKAVDPNETGKLLAAKINQLELDAAGEKDQEIEIGKYSHIDYQMRWAAELGLCVGMMRVSTSCAESSSRLPREC